jgi:chromate reductase
MRNKRIKDVTQLVGISGSLRQGSLNTELLQAMRELLPEHATLAFRSIVDIPLYNADLDVNGGPEPVRALKAEIDAADGLIIATPEYNYGVPGVLKNAIDWVSRPAYKSVFVGKPVAIVGAAPGIVGTARAQAELRNVLFGTLAEVFPYPEILVGRARQQLSDGRLTDETTRKVIGEMLERYVARIKRSA